MKFEKIQPGTTVFDVGKQRVGNTTLSTVAVWPVQIIEVDPVRRTVQASWNGNAPRTFRQNAYSKWKPERPLLVQGAFGIERLATKEERELAKQAV